MWSLCRSMLGVEGLSVVGDICWWMLGGVAVLGPIV